MPPGPGFGARRIKARGMHEGHQSHTNSIFTEQFDPFERLLALICDRSAIHPTGFKTDFLLRRVHERMALLGLDDLDGYTGRVVDDPNELDELLNSLGVQVSHFFRDPEVYGLLEKTVLPGLVEEQSVDGTDSLRIWSAGCSSGEEPYSMAILARQTIGDAGNCHIFATDINTEALKAAARGEYTRNHLLDTRLGILDRHFTRDGARYRLDESIRDMVHFSRADITAPKRFTPRESVFRTYSVVLCRNVLIYCSDRSKDRALGNLTRSVVEGGYLVLGEAEILPEPHAAHYLQPFENLPLYRKRTSPRGKP